MRVAATSPSVATAVFAPAFALPPGGGSLQPVVPLQAIEFVVEPRQLLPAVKSPLACRAEGGLTPLATEALERGLQAAAAVPGGGVAAYLAARAALLADLPDDVDAVFELEGGSGGGGGATVVLRPLPAGAAAGWAALIECVCVVVVVV